MTIKEAEEVKTILDNIKIMENGADEIRRLNKSGEHERVAIIACELYAELQRHYETDLQKYPSPKR